MEFFTQCATVLFDRPPALDVLERALEGWAVAGPQQAASGDDGWAACGPGFVVALRDGGTVIVDVVDRPWPDDAAERSRRPSLEAAWRAGLFGPTSAPGALARAKAQAWAWEAAAAACERHRAFVRMRTVVSLPADAARELPAGHDPLHELTTLTELAGDVLRLQGALGLFMPGGEALRSPAQVEAVLRRKAGLGPPPIELWLNLRAAGIGQEGSRRWLLVDVVGMGQLRLPDGEALFAEGEEAPEAVAPLLHDACLHLLAGRGIAPGSTCDDASARRWEATSAQSVLAPRRAVTRWLACGSARPSDALLAKLAAR